MAGENISQAARLFFMCRRSLLETGPWLSFMKVYAILLCQFAVSAGIIYLHLDETHACKDLECLKARIEMQVPYVQYLVPLVEYLALLIVLKVVDLLTEGYWALLLKFIAVAQYTVVLSFFFVNILQESRRGTLKFAMDMMSSCTWQFLSANGIAFMLESFREDDPMTYTSFFHILVLIAFSFMNSWLLGSFVVLVFSSILLLCFMTFSYLTGIQRVLKPLFVHLSAFPADEPQDHIIIAVQLHMLFSLFLGLFVTFVLGILGWSFS